MCPNCRATFVAPPSPPNLDLAAQPVDPYKKRRRPWWPVVLAFCLAICGLVGIAVSLLPASHTPQIPVAEQSMLQIQAPAPSVPVAKVAGAEPDQGIFHVESQTERPPIIAIGNGSGEAFRLQIENSSGAIQTEWIAPKSVKNIVVQAGAYTASIDAPNDRAVKPAQGQVQVKDFHHYEADFFIGQATSRQNFYIGD